MKVSTSKHFEDALPGPSALVEKATVCTLTMCRQTHLMRTALVVSSIWSVYRNLEISVASLAEGVWWAPQLFLGMIGASFVWSLAEETYLRWRGGSGEGKTVYILPKHDALLHGITHVPGAHLSVLQAAEGQSVHTYRVDTAAEILSILKREGQITTLWINAHGNPRGIKLSRNRPLLRAEELKSFPRASFAPGARIILESCSTGQRPSPSVLSFAEKLQNIVGPHIQVVAPATDIWSDTGTRVNGQGRVHFVEEGQDVTVRPAYAG